MKSIHYIEDELFFGRRIFELRGTMLQIGSTVFGGSKSSEIDLTDCVADYTIRKGMAVAALSRATTYLIIVLILATLIYGFLPAHSVWIIILTLIVAYPGIYVTIRSLAPFEVLQFRDSKGKILFDLIRPRKKLPQSNLQEFVAKIQCNLIEARRPNEVHKPTSGPMHSTS